MRGNSGYSLECGRARTHIAAHSLVAGPGARRRCRGEPLSATEIVPREAFLVGQIGIFYNRAVYTWGAVPVGSSQYNREGG